MLYYLMFVIHPQSNRFLCAKRKEEKRKRKDSDSVSIIKIIDGVSNEGVLEGSPPQR